MIIQIIRLKSGLSEEELLEVANERKPRFEAIPGLLQFQSAVRGGRANWKILLEGKKDALDM